MGSHSSNDFTALWAQHDLGDVVVSAKEVHDRVLELGRQITADYAESPPLLVCVLKGAINFMSDLMRAIAHCRMIGRLARQQHGQQSRRLTI